jgi:hypothetical protein
VIEHVEPLNEDQDNLGVKKTLIHTLTKHVRMCLEENNLLLIVYLYKIMAKISPCLCVGHCDME